jgi:hypothetical protein
MIFPAPEVQLSFLVIPVLRSLAYLRSYDYYQFEIIALNGASLTFLSLPLRP